ncbi:MAG TPA: DNA methyltransferase [Pyrinomonadaceae bacterium]|jgi:DNA modification methylase
MKNLLYCGDNLDVLRKYVDAESVDLIYIDPPFNSKRDYNIFFDEKDSQTQRIAFEDTWSYKNIQDSLAELRTLQTHNLYTLLESYRIVAPLAFPYLVVMTLRLVELHRVLKRTGSFYLHCDSTMSHYLKTICDAIFGEKNFRNEIIWKRTSSHNDSRKWAHIQDTILFYAGKGFTWNPIYLEHDPVYVKNFYRFSDNRGRYRLHEIIRTASMGPRPNLAYEYKGYTPEWGWRMVREKVEALDKDGRLEWSGTGRPYLKRYLHEQEGTPASTIWLDIPPLSAAAAERLGYPTQKPKALLERIIQASSNEGDVVLDAFCGCGTTIDAAEGLHRRWIGIDISPVAISLMKRRMTETYKNQLSSFEILGVPKDEPSAIKLWQENAFAFQDWWLMEYDVFSTTFGTKGPDKGIDGLGLFAERNSEPARIGFQVKGGKHISSKDIDAFMGAMQKFQCSMGVFMSINNPTPPMMETVASSDFINIGKKHYPRLQLITLHDHFLNRRPKLPPVNLTFRSAQYAGKKLMQYTLGF